MAPSLGQPLRRRRIPITVGLNEDGASLRPGGPRVPEVEHPQDRRYSWTASAGRRFVGWRLDATIGRPPQPALACVKPQAAPKRCQASAVHAPERNNCLRNVMFWRHARGGTRILSNALTSSPTPLPAPGGRVPNPPGYGSNPLSHHNPSSFYVRH